MIIFIARSPNTC